MFACVFVRVKYPYTRREDSNYREKLSRVKFGTFMDKFNGVKRKYSCRNPKLVHL